MAGGLCLARAADHIVFFRTWWQPRSFLVQVEREGAKALLNNSRGLERLRFDMWRSLVGRERDWRSHHR
jgi:hypothetical protein